MKLKLDSFFFIALTLSMSTACSNWFGDSSAIRFSPGVPFISGVSVSNNVLLVAGSNLDRVTSLSLPGSGSFTIMSQSSSQLTAVPVANVSFNLGTIYSFLVSNAEASGTNDVTFNVTGASAGSVFFADTSGVITSDAANLFWDSAQHRLGIGTVSPSAALTVSGTTNSNITSHYFSNGTYDGGGLAVYRSRGTEAAPLSVQSYDILAGIILGAYDGNVYQNTAYILANNTNNAGVSAGHIPTDLQFWTGTSSSNVGLRMTVDYTGKVGIGTAAPLYPLDVVGDINASGTVRAAGVALTSDERLKSDIKPVTNALDKVTQLRGVNYYWKDQVKRGNSLQLGVLAQEVEKVFPEAVIQDAKGMKAVLYTSLIAPLIEAVKELVGSNAKINARLDALEKQNQALTLEIKHLKEKSAHSAH